MTTWIAIATRQTKGKLEYLHLTFYQARQRHSTGTFKATLTSDFTAVFLAAIGSEGVHSNTDWEHCYFDGVAFNAVTLQALDTIVKAGKNMPLNVLKALDATLVYQKDYPFFFYGLSEEEENVLLRAPNGNLTA